MMMVEQPRHPEDEQHTEYQQDRKDSTIIILCSATTENSHRISHPRTKSQIQISDLKISSLIALREFRFSQGIQVLDICTAIEIVATSKKPHGCGNGNTRFASPAATDVKAVAQKSTANAATDRPAATISA